jgi:hypothetical protein
LASIVSAFVTKYVERGLDGLRFLDRDGAVLADLVHRVGDDLADGGVPVRGNGRDLLDLFLVLDLLGDLVELADGGFHGLLDAALDADRVRAAGHIFETFAVDGLGEHGRRGGAVARVVARLAGDFADHLGAHVFKRVFQFDFLRDGDAVLGHGRGAEFFVEHDVAAFRSERGDDGLGELGDAAQDGLTGCLIEQQLFSCHILVLGVLLRVEKRISPRWRGCRRRRGACIPCLRS